VSSNGIFGISSQPRKTAKGETIGSVLSAALRAMLEAEPQPEPESEQEGKPGCPFGFQFECEAVDYVYDRMLKLSSVALDAGDVALSLQALRAADLVGIIGRNVLDVNGKTADDIDKDFWNKMHTAVSLAHPEYRCALFGGPPEPEPGAAANSPHMGSGGDEIATYRGKRIA
jgi:hypothetical protein